MSEEKNILEETASTVAEKVRKTRRNYHKKENYKQEEGTKTKRNYKTRTPKIMQEVKDGELVETSIAKEVFKKSSLKIIPLGGLHEIGKNITVFEYEDEMIVVDCGLSFPEDDMLGVDLVIPDITYLVKNQEKLKGMVITHGHEDHIGGIPYFLKQINTPIYATRLAAGLISNKLEEHKLLRSTEMHIVTQGETIQLGKNFKVEFIRSSHSIPDSVMLAITTPAGTILHTGDFKVDYTPIDGQLMDFGRIAELGNKGILALMSDSTNAERKGFTMSESSVGELFDTVFQNCSKRIVVATFASNVHRIQQIVNSAIKYNRKIAVCGRSMINIINTSIELGYIKCPDNIFIDIDMIGTYTDEQLVIITTGSQGEPMAGLSRIAYGNHRKIKLQENSLHLAKEELVSYESTKKEVEDLRYRLINLREIKIQNSSLTQKIKRMSQTVWSKASQAVIDEKMWIDIEVLMVEVYPDIVKALRDADLSFSEMHLCFLTLFKLDTKAMSTLLNIIPTSVDKTRLRVRKKLHWEGKQDFYESLIHIKPV